MAFAYALASFATRSACSYFSLDLIEHSFAKGFASKSGTKRLANATSSNHSLKSCFDFVTFAGNQDMIVHSFIHAKHVQLKSCFDFVTFAVSRS
jgi:hypothetical protein